VGKRYRRNGKNFPLLAYHQFHHNLSLYAFFSHLFRVDKIGLIEDGGEFGNLPEGSDGTFLRGYRGRGGDPEGIPCGKGE